MNEIFVVDFELSQLGDPSQDLGQCFAELYLLYHFRNLKSAWQIICSLAEGYVTGRSGGKNDDLGFAVAMHMGIHLIVLSWRVGGWDKGREKMTACVRFGNDCLVKGWRRERQWFKGGCLDGLFKD